jgi:hypothetical protein
MRARQEGATELQVQRHRGESAGLDAEMGWRAQISGGSGLICRQRSDFELRSVALVLAVSPMTPESRTR